MPDISIIIPCYNHAHYLPSALRSILAQTYTAWEAIIVNDGSTDNTAAIAASFVDTRIHYITQRNQGLSAARNTGVRHAQGQYLAFLDADDEWEPTFLATCLSFLAQRPALAGVYTRCRFITPQGNVLPQEGGQALEASQFRTRILEGGFFPVHAAVIRSSSLSEIGEFDTNLTSAEDWDLWIRLSKQHQMCGLPEPLARYRVYPGSMSTNISRMHANRVAALTKHFGSPSGDPAGWEEEKRKAFAFAYRATALGYLQQGKDDEVWYWLSQAVTVWPSLLARLDTCYELVCGDQGRGYRGDASQLDIRANEAAILHGMNALFAAADKPSQALRGVAYGNAYLALAMLSDQAGKWGVARRYLVLAVRHNPRLLSRSLLRRLVKLAAGERVVGFMKSLRRSSHSQHRAPTRVQLEE